MSAVLAHEQIDSVVADLELLKDIRSAKRDLRDSELTSERMTLTIGCRDGIKEQPVCFVHGGSFMLAYVALQAMEREVQGWLAEKAIKVSE